MDIGRSHSVLAEVNNSAVCTCHVAHLIGQNATFGDTRAWHDFGPTLHVLQPCSQEKIRGCPRIT